jgi:hypothetical protein
LSDTLNARSEVVEIILSVLPANLVQSSMF